MMRYLAYDEGCYECGEPSGVIGLFDVEDDAIQAVRKAEKHQQANWKGQHYMHIIDLENPEMSEHAK